MGKYDEFIEFGKTGGETAAKNMSPEQRSERARKAALSRWKKAKEAEIKAGYI